MAALPVLQGAGVASAAMARRLSDAEREEIARGLAGAVEGEVRFDAHSRGLYATDASLYQAMPVGVVIPASVADAVRAIEFCHRRGVAVLPRGGGTSLAGQCTNHAVVIDFSTHCRALLGVDAGGRTARVEPGITVDELNEALEATGLFFAPDPATSRHAAVGGCIGNNAAGARSIRYGRTSENLMAIDACLSDGKRAEFGPGAARKNEHVRRVTLAVVDVVRRNAGLIRERFPKTIRRNAGYGLDMILAQLDAATDPLDVSLAPLLCGSEGTLAVTLGATLKLHARPRTKVLAVLGLASLDDAIERVLAILATGPSAVELLDDMVIDLARANAEYRRYVELMPAPAGGAGLKAALYVEYFADSAEEAGERIEALRRVVPGVAMQVHTDTAAMLSAWKLRRAGEPLLHGIPGRRKPITFVEDNAIPVERLGEFVRELRGIVTRHGTTAAYWAHASVGVLHVRPLLDIHDEGDRERMRAIAVEAADLARRLGGVMSGEHGDGRVRGPLLERFFGKELMGAFREVKAAFDPKNLLNPGNIVDISGEDARPLETMTQSLRVEPAPGKPAAFMPGIETYFAYADQHGFDGAVEMCNGAGVCRKKQGGTMCPSYMATLDERHSTRGRGNALRLAITGQLPGTGADPWSDAETMRTLDLCLSCKACKTECPSNVDIARLKAEYTAQRYRLHGAPLSSRVMGNIRMLNRLGSLAPGLANWMGGLAPARVLLEAVLGIDRRRSLPKFAARLDGRWRSAERRDSGGEIGAGAPTVVLFGDCFTIFNETSIGLATRRVLRAFGYRVVLADAGCCARARISLGLLPEAITEADATMARLRPWSENENVRAILVAEPSCLSAIKDDWLSLKLRTPRHVRVAIAEKCFLPEDFLERFWELHPRRPVFRRVTNPVLLHGHCHQKALWGVQTSARMLQRVAGDRVRVPDSGCCGMAGSFGYTKDRFELSGRIGELVLMPAVRALEAGGEIAAPGTSCRHQIHDSAGRRARHPIELLAGWLDEKGGGS